MEIKTKKIKVPNIPPFDLSGYEPEVIKKLNINCGVPINTIKSLKLSMVINAIDQVPSATLYFKFGKDTTDSISFACEGNKKVPFSKEVPVTEVSNAYPIIIRVENIYFNFLSVSITDIEAEITYESANDTIKYGNTDIVAVFKGVQNIENIYIGNKLIL